MNLLKKILLRFFRLNSPVELFLRSFYHRIAANQFMVSIQIWQAKQSYLKWSKIQKKLQLPNPNSYKYQPKVTFLMMISSSNLTDAIKTILSIQNMNISNWEIITIQMDERIETIDIPFVIREDQRIKHISEGRFNYPNYYSESSGEFILHCVAGDSFYVAFMDHFYQSINSSPQYDVFYYDCEYWDKTHSRILPYFKPSAFSPELLLSVNYLSRGLIRKSLAVLYSQDTDSKLSLLNQELDLFFHLIEKKVYFHHIPHVLITQFQLTDDHDDQVEKVIRKHLSKSGPQEIICQKVSNNKRYQWKINEPSISIIIPSKNNHELIRELISSILSSTEYSNYTITVIDNQSDDIDTLSYYRELKMCAKVSVINYDKKFNYSEAINLGVSQTTSTLLLILNDDLKILNPYWMRELAQWALQPEIGIVGTKLLRVNQTIQHAGIVIGLQGLVGHLYLNTPDHFLGFSGSVDWIRDVSAVTGACQMMRRDVFLELGGYDEDFQLVFSDIDFCLRAIDMGFRVVYTPFASLIHYEGKTRGYLTPESDIKRGFKKLGGRLEIDDPYFSPNLTYSTIPKCQIKTNNN